MKIMTRIAPKAYLSENPEVSKFPNSIDIAIIYKNNYLYEINYFITCS